MICIDYNNQWTQCSIGVGSHMCAVIMVLQINAHATLYICLFLRPENNRDYLWITIIIIAYCNIIKNKKSIFIFGLDIFRLHLMDPKNLWKLCIYLYFLFKYIFLTIKSKLKI